MILYFQWNAKVKNPDVLVYEFVEIIFNLNYSN